MIRKTAIRKDKNLTAAAKKVFGNIVKKAYVTTWNSCNYSNKIKIETIKFNTEENKKIDPSSKSFDIDSQTIWIEFNNGKVVEFNSSEWCIISEADTENSYLI